MTLDYADGVTIIVPEHCDRFVVRIKDDKMERIVVEGAPIATVQVAANQIANFAIELLEVPGTLDEVSSANLAKA